jgi:hypothetical protein
MKERFRRTHFKQLLDQTEIARLYLEGKTLPMISAATRLSITTIKRDLRKIRERWLAASAQTFAERRAVELKRIDQLEAEAWRAWEESKQPAIATKVRSGGNGQGAASKETSITRSPREGDASYMEVVVSCIDKRCRIYGLYAPSRISPAEADTLLDQLIDEEAERQARDNRIDSDRDVDIDD